MTIRMSENDEKKLDEIRKWLVFDSDHNLVFRENTPDDIRKERERISKKYDWLD